MVVGSLELVFFQRQGSHISSRTMLRTSHKRFGMVCNREEGVEECTRVWVLDDRRPGPGITDVPRDENFVDQGGFPPRTQLRG
jgi:hypothetical protein